MRKCKIPQGCKRPDKPCCADCKDKTCEARCWNSPKRCNCVEEGPPPRISAARKYDWTEILHLHEQGLSTREIAARLGARQSTISAALRKMGVCRDGRS